MHNFSGFRSSAFRAFNHGRPLHQARARMCTAAAAGASLGPFMGPSKAAVLRLGSAMMLGGGAAVAFSKSGSSDELDKTSSIPWVQELEAQESVEEVLSPGQMFRKHPVGKVLVDQDHLFEVMMQNGQIGEFRCFYDRKKKEFHSIVQLGKDVCGFPQTVHGGLTAAILDETLGGLGVCMWRSGALGFRPPAYTARLELDYKRKIPAGSIVMCSTQVEKIDNRKIWMTGQMTDGEGVVYASARALFVAPRLKTVLWGWIPGLNRS